MNLPIRFNHKFLERLHRLGPDFTINRPDTAHLSSIVPDIRQYNLPYTEISEPEDIRKMALGMGLDPDQPDAVNSLGWAMPYHEYGHDLQHAWLKQKAATAAERNPDLEGAPIEYRTLASNLARARRMDSEFAFRGGIRPEIEAQYLDSLSELLGAPVPWALQRPEIRIPRSGHEAPSDLVHLAYRFKPGEWDADIRANELVDTDVLSDPEQPKLIPARQMARFRTTLGRNQMAAELPLSRARRRGPDPEAEYAALEARLREPLQTQLPFDQLALQRALMP